MCNPQKKKELQRAKQELHSLIKYQAIAVESGYDEITAEEEWQALCAKIELEGKLCVMQNVSKETENTKAKCVYHWLLLFTCATVFRVHCNNCFKLAGEKLF